MADTDAKVTSASDATASSDVATSKAGLNTSQPTKDAGVEANTVEDKGNSGASDESGGADSEQTGRSRPGRAERRISELSARVKEQQDKINEQNSLINRLSRDTVDASKINLPDYSQMTEITPDQLKQDVVKAASQIVDLKMATVGSVVDAKIASRDVESEIRSAINKYPVLDPNSDYYDKELDEDISNTFVGIRDKDPTYSFASFLKPMERFLADQSNVKSQDTANSEVRNRGTSANRASGNTKPAKAFAEMNLQEMEAYFASKRSR